MASWNPALGAAALCGALLIDLLLGEPPAWAHPVVWMGRYLGALGPRMTAWAARPAFVGGAAAWCLGACVAVSLAAAADRVLVGWPAPLAAIALALLLKPLMAWRMLRDEVAAVDDALGQSLLAGRRRLQRLVSRDVESLDATQIRESAIESMAENLNDSVVAPLFWFAVAGLPGAALYRFANTADAMWGYRGRYEWVGKWAAHADDVLSWVPARLTALLLCVAARRMPAFAAVRREARITPSPNGGWPMGVMALLLGVHLGKPGVYVLNADGAACASTHVRQALAWGQRAALWSALAGAALILALGPLHRGALP